MIKILIADDELIVRIGLKTTIDWETNGYTIVGEASNGKDALDLFAKFKPDIVITDIKMPVMDGLTLIEALKRQSPNVKTVILTHYDDFTYAKNALNLGASEYLLKTELTEEKLLMVLSKLCNQILSDRSFSSKDESGKISNQIIIDANQRYKLLHAIVEMTINDQESILKHLNKISTSFEGNMFRIACASYDLDITGTNYDDSSKLYYSLDTVTRNLMSKRGWRHTIYLDRNKIVFLFIKESNPEIKSDNDFIQLKNNIEQYFGLKLRFGVSDATNNIARIPEIYENALKVWSLSYFEFSSVIFFDKHVPQLDNSECPQIDLYIIRELLQTENVENLISYLDVIFNKLEKSKKIDFVKKCFIDALSIAKMTVNEYKEIKFDENIIKDKIDYDVFETITCFKEMKNYIYDLYHLLYKYVKGDLNSLEKYSSYTSLCIAFIKSNYRKPISLTDMSNHTGISKCYLSLVFKQETGTNISTYLTNYRISKAKKMLSTTNMKIYEIAEEVGFDNPYYFSKVFKDITGESCRSYKNRKVKASDMRIEGLYD